jgi:hypothetical protein
VLIKFIKYKSYMGSSFEICCPPSENLEAPAATVPNDDSEEEVKVVIGKPV